MSAADGHRQIARVDNFRCREEDDAATSAFTLNLNICRADNLRPAFAGLGRAVRNGHIEGTTIDIGAGAVAQATDNCVGAGREKDWTPAAWNLRNATDGEAGGNVMVAAIINRPGWLQVYECARRPGCLLAADRNVARTEQMDGIW